MSLPNFNKKAIIIGIDDYEYPKCKTLKYAAKDAIEITEVLINEEFCNFTPNEVFLLISFPEPSSKKSYREQVKTRLENLKKKGVNIKQPYCGTIERTLQDLSKELKVEDRILFYFAGHGDYLKESDNELANSYLLAKDSYIDEKTGKYKHAITLFDLQYQLLSTCKAKDKIMFIDACHGSNHRGPQSETMHEKFQKALDVLTLSDWFVFSACSKDEESNESIIGDNHTGNGIFSYLIINGLKGDAHRDKNSPFIYLEDLKIYVLDNIKVVLNKIEQPKVSQNPICFSSLSSNIEFSKYSKYRDQNEEYKRKIQDLDHENVTLKKTIANIRKSVDIQNVPIEDSLESSKSNVEKIDNVFAKLIKIALTHKVTIIYLILSIIFITVVIWFISIISS